MLDVNITLAYETSILLYVDIQHVQCRVKKKRNATGRAKEAEGGCPPRGR